MKTKYIIPSLLAVLALAAACSDDDEITLLDEVQVSSSYIALPVDGGSTAITVTAKYDWEIDDSDLPEWLEVSPSAASAGTTTVTFAAGETLDSRSATLYLVCNGKKQILEIIQGVGSAATEATIAEVMNGVNSKTYRVTGTVTAIANTEYGNFYMNDGTTDDDLYIYGTVNSSGSYAWSTFGVEVGDEVTVEGPRSTYGTVVELVDATFISVTKSLISVSSTEPEDGQMPLEGGEFTANLACSGDGVTVDIPDDAKDWLSITSIVSAGGEVTIKFNVARNDGGDRNTTIVFYTVSGSNEYSCQTTITQAGSIMPVSIAEFNAAQTGEAQYRITGYVSSIDNAERGRFHLKDFSGETYVYNMDGFADSGINEGDIVSVVGKRDEYDGTVEMTSAWVEEVTPVTAASVADFRGLSDDSGAYYRLTGTVCRSSEDGTKFDLDTYGNFALKDDTGEVYVYGVSTGVGGESGQFGTLGVREGDEITIICYKTSYGGLTEAGGAMYVSHASAD